MEKRFEPTFDGVPSALNQLYFITVSDGGGNMAAQ